MRLAMTQMDSTINSTFITITLSIIGLQDIDTMAKIIFMGASTISCATTCIIGYYKIKNLKNEKDIKKH